jgi:hypothetical protein
MFISVEAREGATHASFSDKLRQTLSGTTQPNSTPDRSALVGQTPTVRQ